jgi:hypothetical protein
MICADQTEVARVGRMQQTGLLVLRCDLSVGEDAVLAMFTLTFTLGGARDIFACAVGHS